VVVGVRIRVRDGDLGWGFGAGGGVSVGTQTQGGSDRVPAPNSLPAADCPSFGPTILAILAIQLPSFGSWLLCFRCCSAVAIVTAVVDGDALPQLPLPICRYI